MPKKPDPTLTATFQEEFEPALTRFVRFFLPALSQEAERQKCARVQTLVSGHALDVLVVLDNGVHRSQTFREGLTNQWTLHLGLWSPFRLRAGLSVGILFSDEPVEPKDALGRFILSINERERILLPTHRLFAFSIAGSILSESSEACWERLKAPLATAVAQSDPFRSLRRDSPPGFNGLFTAAVRDAGPSHYAPSYYDPAKDEIVLSSALGKPFLSTALITELQVLGITTGIKDTPVASTVSLAKTGPRGSWSQFAKIQKEPGQTFDLGSLLARHVTLAHELAHRYLFHVTSSGFAFRVMMHLTQFGAEENSSGARAWINVLERKALRLLRKWIRVHERLAIATLLMEIRRIRTAIKFRLPLTVNCQCNLILLEDLLRDIEWPLETAIQRRLDGLLAAVRASDGEIASEVEAALSARFPSETLNGFDGDWVLWPSWLPH